LPLTADFLQRKLAENQQLTISSISATILGVYLIQWFFLSLVLSNNWYRIGPVGTVSRFLIPYAVAFAFLSVRLDPYQPYTIFTAVFTIVTVMLPAMIMQEAALRWTLSLRRSKPAVPSETI
jgi:hypothetical protein